MCLPCERERLPDDADGRWRQINRTQNLFEHAGSQPIDSVVQWARSGTGQSERATTVAVTEPIGRIGRSAPAAPITITSARTDLANRRIWVPGSPCLTAAPVWTFSESMVMSASRSFVIMSARSREPRPSGATRPLVTTTWNALSSALRARAIAFAHSERVHGQRRQIHRAENVT